MKIQKFGFSKNRKIENQKNVKNIFLDFQKITQKYFSKSEIFDPKFFRSKNFHRPIFNYFFLREFFIDFDNFFTGICLFRCRLRFYGGNHPESTPECRDPVLGAGIRRGIQLLPSDSGYQPYAAQIRAAGHVPRQTGVQRLSRAGSVAKG